MAVTGNQLKTLTIDGTSLENDFHYLGTNPTGGVANDTPAFWRTLGSGYCTINADNQLIDQPATNLCLINFVDGDSRVYQYAKDFSANTLWMRGAGGSATAMGAWTPHLQSGDYVNVDPSNKVRVLWGGSYGNISANTPLATSTNKDVSLFTVEDEGQLIITATMEFATNATGVRYGAIVRSRNGGAFDVMSARARISASTSGTTIIGLTTQNLVKVGDVIGVRAWQNSGATINLNSSTYYFATIMKKRWS